MDGKLYTAAELAELKGVQVESVYAMVSKGRITHVTSTNGSRTHLFDENTKNKYLSMRSGRPRWKKKVDAGQGDGQDG